MRDLALVSVLLALIALAAARPFVGVLVWSWISFMNPHREVWSFAGQLPWAMIAFLATMFGCFVAREPKRFPLNAVTVPMLLMLVCITVTSLVALGAPDAVWSKWDRTMKMFAGVLLTAALLTERRRIHAMVWLMAIAMGYYGVKGGIFTLVTGGSFIVLGPEFSMIRDRNHLAVAMLVAIPLMNYLRLNSRHHVVRLGLIGAMGSTLFAVVGSQSRGALVALIATGFVFWLRSHGKILSSIAIVAAIAVAISFMPDSWVERMNTIRNYEADGSAMGRLAIWRMALGFALMRPLVGGGFRAFYSQQILDYYFPGSGVRAAAAHSIWLEVLGEHGFPTFAVWLAMLAGGILYTLRIARIAKDEPSLRWAYDLARMTQVSIVAYCSGGTFLSLAYWDVFWTLMALIGATHALVVAAKPAPVREATAPAARRWQPQAAALRPARGVTASR